MKSFNNLCDEQIKNDNLEAKSLQAVFVVCTAFLVHFKVYSMKENDVLNFSLFLTQSYYMASEELEYGT